MTNELATLFFIILAAFIAYDVFINKAFSNRKNSKENTVNAIEKANSKKYRIMVMHNEIINNVIDDMLADPFWLDIINNSNN